LLSGEDLHRLSTVFGNVGAEEFFRLKAGSKEMNIINQRVLDAGSRQNGWKLRLPNALGQPGPIRRLAEKPGEIIRQTRDLLLLVLRWNGDQNGLVKSSADHFHLATVDQLSDKRKIVRTIPLNPLEQRTGIMQADVDCWMSLEQLKKRQIALVVRF